MKKSETIYLDEVKYGLKTIKISYENVANTRILKTKTQIKLRHRMHGQSMICGTAPNPPL